MRMALSRRTVLYLVLSFIGSLWAVYFYNSTPAFTDSYYHFNGAESIATGNGFTDPYLWVYIGAPDYLPAPSHLYWMPGTSVILSLGMVIFGTSYGVAQIGLVLCLWGAMILAYWLGGNYGGSARHAWLAGILTLFSGFFLDTWGQTDTFAPYALFGGLALVMIALGISSEKNNWKYWLLAGIFSACGHLIRNDGLLLLLTGWSVLFWIFDTSRFRQRIMWFLVFTAAYLLTMTPWFLRNQAEIGRILPTGGTQNAWLVVYDELFNYPPDASPETLFADGNGAFLEARRLALFTNNSITLQAIVYQGASVFFPFILLGLWNRRREPFVRPFWIFALGLFLAFALVFPYAGMRGGYWHGVSALVPIWAVMGLVGLDDFITYISRRRRTWNPKTARPFLSVGLTMITIILTFYLSQRNITRTDEIALELIDTIPEGSLVMSVDTSQLYYYTGFGGVVIPNEPPTTALEIANLYNIDYLLLQDDGIPEPMQFDEPPNFLIPIEFEVEGVRLYAFERD